MSETYKAIEVSRPGKFSEVSRPLLDPGPGQVRIRVEACGVCHTDSLLVDGALPNLTYPRVPGHEVIGRIDAVGSNVTTRSVGQRVGVGICGGWDDTCLSCLRGDFVNCTNGVLTGIMMDGGYAEVMIIEARTTVTIPDGLESVKAAPLLCAGVTTYNALRNAGVRAGALVAIQGVGGLGHLGIQYARRMGLTDHCHWARSGVGEARKRTRRAPIHRQRSGRCGSEAASAWRSRCHPCYCSKWQSNVRSRKWTRREGKTVGDWDRPGSSGSKLYRLPRFSACTPSPGRLPVACRTNRKRWSFLRSKM